MTGDVRHKLLENLCALIRRMRPSKKPFIVGITGIDGSGKTELARELEHALKRCNQEVQTIHVDDFHNPKSVRYVPDLPEPQQYYMLSINFKRLVNEVLLPIKRYGELHTTLTVLDLHTDRWLLQRHYTVTSNTVVLLEGVFLFRPEIRPYVDLFVYLHVTEDVAIQRARVRDVPTQGEGVLRKYKVKYLPAQREYLQRFCPERYADVVIDNCDWKNPRVRIWPEMMFPEVSDDYKKF